MLCTQIGDDMCRQYFLCEIAASPTTYSPMYSIFKKQLSNRYTSYGMNNDETHWLSQCSRLFFVLFNKNSQINKRSRSSFFKIFESMSFKIISRYFILLDLVCAVIKEGHFWPSLFHFIILLHYSEVVVGALLLCVGYSSFFSLGYWRSLPSSMTSSMTSPGLLQYNLGLPYPLAYLKY